MYLKVVRAAGGKGVKHEYVRLIESYRKDGKPQQRVVCNLGRKDLLAAHLNSLNRLLTGKSLSDEDNDLNLDEQIKEADSWDWGPMLVARSLWCELGLEQILDRLGGRGKSDGTVMSDRALVLVANRLCAPTSEHGLARWMETDFVCDRKGRRWEPKWRDDQQRLASRLPRVRVRLSWLKQWYRTLDQLYDRKKQIEKELFLRLRDLFSLEVDLVFYDLTSTYFEGRGPAGLSANGYSRDHRPRNRQVLVGLVMVDGWPIAHHVFAGNWRDEKTVPDVLNDLKERFGLRRVVFVGDRGMVTSTNLALLRSSHQGYIVGLQRRRRENIYQCIERATGDWIECSGGITSREKFDPPKTLVQEVGSKEPDVRTFVVHSDERLAYERGQRQKAMQRAQEALERLERRVRKGQLKAPEKVGAAAARIQARYHGYRYYDWEYKGGRFRFFEHPVNLKREQAYEGKYVIQTEEKNLSATEVVRIYKELSEVERAFMNLKDVIEMRPIFHQRPERVEAHLFVATLAFLLHRAVEKKLKAAGLDLSATEALQAVRTVRVIDLELIDKNTKRLVTRGSSRAKAIMSALGIIVRDPSPGERAL